MSINLNSFVPTSQLRSGNKGLHWTKDSTSTASLTGSGLANGLTVTVLYFPSKSPNPTIKWTGTTYNFNPATTSCDVDLDEKLDNDGPAHTDYDTSVTVSVTATDGTTTSNTIEPTIITAS